MTTYKINSWVLEHFEEEIEANSEDEAKDKFEESYENGELESDEGYVFFEDEGEYDMVETIISEEIEESEEK
jgi:hypothetical protein